MVSKAIARFARISPRKARVIVESRARPRRRRSAAAPRVHAEVRRARSSRSSSRAPSPTPARSSPASTSTRSSSDRHRRQGAEQVTCAAGARARWAAPPAFKRASATSPSILDEREYEQELMGQKTHPYGFRLGVIKTWNCKWYEDKAVREVAPRGHPHQARGQGLPLQRQRRERRDRARRQQGQGHRLHGAPGHGDRQGRQGHRDAQERQPRRPPPRARPSFPGVQSFTDNEVFIDVQEVRKAETNAQLVAENVATQLERRIAFRRAMKKARLDRDEVRRQGHPHPLRGSPRRQRRWAASRRTARVASRSTRCAPTSSSAWPRPAPRTASSASRSGSSRARCCSASAPPTTGFNAPELESDDHAFPQANQVPQDAEGQQPRRRASAAATCPSATSRCRPSSRGRLTVAPDRGRPYGDPAPREARRQALDPHLPGQARSPRSRSKSAWVAARAASRSGSAVVKPGRVLYEISRRDRGRRARGLPPRGATSCPSRYRFLDREEVTVMKAKDLRERTAEDLARAREDDSAKDLFDARFKNFTNRSTTRAPLASAARSPASRRSSRQGEGRGARDAGVAVPRRADPKAAARSRRRRPLRRRPRSREARRREEAAKKA